TTERSAVAQCMPPRLRHAPAHAVVFPHVAFLFSSSLFPDKSSRAHAASGRPTSMSLRSSVRWALVAVAAAVVLWVRLLPLTLDDVPDAALLRYRGDDHREHVYLGDVDSYLWLRYARNYLRSGTTCDAIVGGDCRDLHTNAPVGTRTRYARS